jgi:hypothetical protein
VIDDPPYIYEANIIPPQYSPQGDSVTITAIESNPQHYNSIVTAYIINSEGVTVDEFALSKIDSINYTGKRVVPVEENVYRVLLKDSGSNIPSNLYYAENSRFTTAGPIKIDSLIISYNPMPRTFRVVPLVRNAGQTFTVENLSITMSSDDSTIIYSIGTVLIDSIQPGEVVLPTSGFFTVKVDSNFSLPFKFNFAIRSDGWLYWRDTISIVTSVEGDETLPEEFVLYENYPNPFNPSTKIKYSVPQSSNVVIKVFDVLGNEIETLTNEEKSAGTYEITWNAIGLPSGVYFYQLRAGDYVNTKKMLLLK